jgi:hypothetical protein
MATQTRYASSVVSATGFVDGANTYSNNGQYATWTSTSRNAAGELAVGIAAFDLPAGSTINTVTLYVDRKWSSGASTLMDWAYCQIALSGTLRGTQYNDTTFPTTDTEFSTDGGTWTEAELEGGGMEVHFDTDRKNTTTSSTHYIDAVWVIVDYNAPSFIYNLKQGANQINAVYVGASNSSAVYLGSDKIFG